MTDAISLELHRAVVAQHSSAFDVLREAHVILDGIIGPDGRKIAARLQDVAADLRATNAALAERVQALKAALDKTADEAATANERAEKWKAAAIALDSAAWKAMDWADGTRVYNASAEVEALNLQEATLKPALAQTAQEVKQ